MAEGECGGEGGERESWEERASEEPKHKDKDGDGRARGMLARISTHTTMGEGTGKRERGLGRRNRQAHGKSINLQVFPDLDEAHSLILLVKPPNPRGRDHEPL